MKTNSIQKWCLLAFVLLLTNAINAQSNVAGTYGVSKEDPSAIQLVLNADNTFTYSDHSNNKKAIDVSGTWSQKGKRVVLKSNSNTQFHNRWKIIEGRIAKSRRGLSFYRICKL